MDQTTTCGTYATRATLLAKLKDSSGSERELCWTEFHRRYAPMIASFARRLQADRGQVDDIIQEVLTAFLSQSATFAYDRSKGHFRGFLKVLTLRTARRLYGKTLRFQGVLIDEIDPEDGRYDPIWNDVYELELYRTALSKLRESEANSLQFRAFEQYVLAERPAEQVAAELATSVANVYKAKQRMTEALRHSLNRERELDE